jgi:type II secretory pathway component GspD/PulD (secretin)
VVELVQVVPVREGPREHKRLALRLRTAQANDLAKTLNGLFREEMKAESAGAAQGVVVVPEAIGNSLLISGFPDAVDEVCRLVQELDRPKALMFLEVVIAKAPADEAKAAPTETLVRARLVAAENEPASLFLGSEEHTIAHVMVMQSGDSQVSYKSTHTGTMLGVALGLRPDGMVVLKFNVTDSRSGLEAVNVDIPGLEDRVIRQKPLELIIAGNTFCLRDGETSVIRCQPPRADAGEQILILVTPHVIDSFTNL